jgi:hypothetical protein
LLISLLKSNTEPQQSLRRTADNFGRPRYIGLLQLVLPLFCRSGPSNIFICLLQSIIDNISSYKRNNRWQSNSKHISTLYYSPSSNILQSIGLQFDNWDHNYSDRYRCYLSTDIKFQMPTFLVERKSLQPWSKVIMFDVHFLSEFDVS